MTTSNENGWATGSARYLREPDEGAGGSAGSAGAAGGSAPGAQPPASQGNGAQGGTSQQGQGAQGQGAQGNASQQGDGEGRTSGKSVVLPQSAMKRIKQEAEERGQRRAQEALAKEFGFSTFAAMREHFAHQPTRREDRNEEPPEEREQPQQHKGNERGNGQQQQSSRSERREQGRWERERERLQREKDALARRMTQEARQRKALQAALDAKDAEMSLREVAVKTGVRDIDYAVRLLTRHLEGLSEEEIAKLDGGKGFDEAKFFEGLRGSHPYLFGEVTKPATTGTGAGNAPPPPKPGAAAQAQQEGNKTDARKMSREEYQELLRKRGLSVGL